MAKGDDALARKKNKSTRKKMNRKNFSSTVSTRFAYILAAKKRRKSGKRSMSQGMCFSLPTPEDPFNEKQITKKVKTKEGSSRSVCNNVIHKEDKNTSPVSTDGDEKMQYGVIHYENRDCPTKFLMRCLSKINILFHNDDRFIDQLEESLNYNTWGFMFYRSFSYGKDILESSGKPSTIENIAWIVAAAADANATFEIDEDSFSESPFLLFLVPSQSRAIMVRSICKQLKDIGFNSVSLHQGASVDHQIHGLKSSDPEFVVSTPERLLEIVNLKGIDISDVKMLVIDDFGPHCTSDYVDAVKSIKQAISSKHQTIVFNTKSTASIIPDVQSLLGRSINRICLNDSIACKSSCIIQSVNVCATEEKKLQKFEEFLDSNSSKIIYIITKEESFRKLKDLLKVRGYSVSANNDSKISQVIKRKPVARLIDIDQVDEINMRDFETVLLPDFFASLDTYIEILTRMARDSVHGVLHSFLTEKQALTHQGGSLVTLLENCRQKVPQPLKKMFWSISTD